MVKSASKHLRSSTALLLVFGLEAFGMCITHANAADVEISDGQTVTTTQTLSDGDTLTIEAGGSLATIGTSSVFDGGVPATVKINNAGGISSQGKAAIGFSNASSILNLENAGTISQSAGVFGAIEAPTINILTNSGTISGFFGIYSVDINHLTNTGGISGVGSGIFAIDQIDTLVNHGTIYTLGNNAVDADNIKSLTNSGNIISNGNDGVRAASTLTFLSNSGTIKATDDGAQGSYIVKLINSGTISGGDNGVNANGQLDDLFNSGTITGQTGNGVDMHSGTIVNSGIISGVRGIQASRTTAGNSHITSSGTIRGTGGQAILLQGAGMDVISLLPGSIIDGTVDFGDGTDDTLSFGKGLSSVIKLGGGVQPATTTFTSPINYSDATTRAQADVSAIGAQNILLSDLRHISDPVHTAIYLAALSEDDIAETGFGYGTFDDGNLQKSAYWVSGWGVGGKSPETSTFSQTSRYLAGVSMGVDWLDENNDLYGMYGGAGLGRLQVNVKNGQTIDTQLFYGGLYTSRQAGEGQISLDVLSGLINFSSSRISDTQTAIANYGGAFIAPTFGYSQEFDLAGQSLLASGTLGYAAMFVNGYSEKGLTSGNLTLASRTVQQLNARGELAWVRLSESATGYLDSFIPYLGLEGAINVGGNQATANFMGQSFNFQTGGNGNLVRGFAGAKVNRKLTEKASLFGAFEASYDSTRATGLAGHIGISVKF